MAKRERLKEVRREKGLSQDQAAHMVGYSGKSSWSMVENGITTPSIWQMKAIAKALGHPIAELFPEVSEEVQDETQAVG